MILENYYRRLLEMSESDFRSEQQRVSELLFSYDRDSTGGRMFLNMNKTIALASGARLKNLGIITAPLGWKAVEA